MRIRDLRRGPLLARLVPAPLTDGRRDPGMALIGYARISTDDGRQTTLRQLDELRAAGCAEVLEEHASGADRARPVLNRLLAGLQPGTTVCVVKLDRLARSTRDLLDIVDTIEKAGAHLRDCRESGGAKPKGVLSGPFSR